MRPRFTLVVVLAVMLIPAAAVAKGPTAASITGLPSPAPPPPAERRVDRCALVGVAPGEG